MSKQKFPDESDPVDPQKVIAMFKKDAERRQIQKVNKQLRRNQQPKPVRRKDWQPNDFDNSDNLEVFGLESVERVMPRGERERRRKVITAVETETAENQSDLVENLSPPQLTIKRGVVIEVSSGLYRVDLGDRILLCSLRGSLKATETGFTNVAAVGDEVLVFADTTGYGVIEQLLPRRSVLARPDVFYRHRQQIIVANADQLLIVASWRNPPLWLELLDRYLIAAQRYNLTPLICVNKIDLAEDQTACQAVLRPYQTLGYQVFFTSARTGEGIEMLREILRGRITALAGLSGVGKSTLLNAVQPGLQLRTGAISDFSGDGQHTTTQVTMLKLAEEGFVVDTPGIREFGLSGLDKTELIKFYPDLAAAAPGCRFADCTHRHEPDCAVKIAVTEGTIAASRYETYQKIYLTLKTS